MLIVICVLSKAFGDFIHISIRLFLCAGLFLFLLPFYFVVTCFWVSVRLFMTVKFCALFHIISVYMPVRERVCVCVCGFTCVYLTSSLFSHCLLDFLFNCSFIMVHLFGCFLGCLILFCVHFFAYTFVSFCRYLNFSCF